MLDMAAALLEWQLGQKLAAWLLDGDNMDKWKNGLSAAERRVLISKLTAEANKEVLNKDTPHDESRLLS